VHETAGRVRLVRVDGDQVPVLAEQHGPPARCEDPAGLVDGSRRVVEQVASILRAKQAGLSPPDIGAFLAAHDPAARKDVLRRNHSALHARMAVLRSALDLLEAGLNCTHEDISTCPNYRAHLTELVDVGVPG